MTGKVYSFKLKEPVSVYTTVEERATASTTASPAAARSIQFAHTEKDAIWRGWEFTADEHGLTIQPPSRCDVAFVPWAGVLFCKQRPEKKPAAR